MGIFGSGKKNGKKKLMPKANPEDWTREDVQQWLGHLGFERYAEPFRPIAGRRLLALTQADLFQLVDTRLDADLLSDAIHDLKLRAAGVAPPRTPPERLADAPAESLPSFNAANTASSAALNDGGVGAPSAPESAAASAGDMSRLQSQGSGIAVTGRSGSFAQGSVGDTAEALSALAGSHDGASELFLYLNKLGILGTGLLEGAQRVPTVGHIVGALWELRDLVAAAKGNRANCNTLAAFGADIMRAFDFQGKKLAFVDTHALDQIAELLKRGCDIADGCGRPGWLPRMALNEKTFEEFKHVHETILAILQEQRIHTLGNGRPLATGDYKDASRPLRRLLKQYGNGSLEQGLRYVSDTPAAQSETIALLSVDKQSLRKELDAVVAGGDLESLAAGDGGLSAGTFGADQDLSNEADVRSREARTVFNSYDRNRSGALEIEELQSCLEDLGLMENKTLTEQDALLAQHFAAADADRDGRVTFDEFAAYLPAVSTNKARSQLRAALGVEVEKDLRRMFGEFAAFGTRTAAADMDGAKFFKLCKESKLLSKRFTAIDCDIIFAKVKQKGARRITFEQFLTALAAIADTKQVPLDSVVKKILQSGGPSSTGTRAEYVKWFDDKNTYTGVSARGGPSAIDAPKGLAQFVDRSAADVRGVKMGSMTGEGRDSLSPPPRTPPLSQRRPRAIHSAEAVADDVDDEELLSVFRSFATFGAGAAAAATPPGKPVEMDGPRFAKLCRETGVQGGRLNSVAVDIIFSSVKAKGARRIGFREFMAALPLMAEDRGISVEEVRALIASGGGPTRNGVTHAGSVRLHDDHSTYTGTNKSGV